MSKRVLSLALKVTGDASGVRLTPVERALQRLGEETEKVGKVFTKFAEDSEVGRLAQEQFAQQSASLTEALRQGTISSQEYAQRFSELADSAQRQAAALEEGRRITLATRTEEEKRTAELANLDRLLKANAIDQQAYTRAVAQASGANQAAAESARVRAAAEAEAARASAAAEAEAQRIRAANLTAQEQFDQAIGRANELRLRGLLTQEEFNRELERQAAVFARNVKGADDLGRAIENAGNQTLKFNELSGVLSVLPGPLGSIAGRISGIASASEGLSRVFAGGLNAGITNVVQSLAALANPLTLALAGITAFAAGATAAVRGLTDLEDRVEKLRVTADKLGVSFQFIQVLEEAARRSGTSIDAVSAAFGRLQNSVLGVDEESKQAQSALSQLGITAAELQSLSPEEQYDRIGRSLAGIEDPARRTATAIALFGKAGADLIPFFNNIDKAAADVDRFGSSLSNVDNSRLDGLGDAFDRVFVSLQAAGQELLLPFTGVVAGLSRLFADVVGTITSVIRPIGDVLTPILDTFGGAFAEIGETIFNVGAIIGRILSVGLTPLRAAFQLLGPAISPAATVLQGVNFILEQLIAFIDRTIQAWDSFASRIPLIGRFLRVSADDGKTAASDLGDAVEAQANRINADLQKAFESGDKALDSAIAKAGQFGQAGFDAAFEFQTALEELQAQANEGELNAEQYTRGVANATAEFERQLAVVQQVSEENKKLADEAEKRAKQEADAIQKIIDSSVERDRLEKEFDGDSSRLKAAENLVAVNEEIRRVEEELRRARAASDQAAIDAATNRLRVLDQVAAGERDIASGFAADRKAQEDIAKRSAEAIDKVLRDGQQFNEAVRNAGVDLSFEMERAAKSFNDGFLSEQQFASRTQSIQAFFSRQIEAQQSLADEAQRQQFESQLQFQTAIEEARRKFDEGIFNKEAFDREVKRQEDLYKKRQDLSKKVFDLENKLLERQFEIERDRAEELSNTKSGAVKIGDIRESGGISAFFEALKEDPAIAEAKKQTRELQGLRRDIQKLEAEKVDILAGVG